MEKKYMKSTLKKESHKPKELTRTFSLQISKDLIKCRKWTQEVIDEIENDRLSVISTNEPLSITPSTDGSIEIDSYFKRQVSIKEWLPIACQNIRRQQGPSDDFDRKKVFACYKSNAAEVLFPVGFNVMPPGPVAFNAAIIFESEFIWSVMESSGGENKFKFALAHELVHVFNFMRFLVPAFQNWKRFWKICLDEGDACEEIEQLWMFKNCFVDSYGNEREFAMVEQYWPKKAKKWFDAFRE